MTKALDRRPRPVSALALVAALVVAAASPARAGCPPTPWDQGTCLSFGRSSLAIDASGNVDWRASRGASATAAAFGGDTDVYQFCIWDEDHLVVAADIPAGAECPGGSCWSLEAGVGYEDDAGVNGDIRALAFTPSDTSRTKLRVTTFVVGGINLPVAGGVIAQLVRNGGESCFEGFLPAESFTLDDRAAFAASFDVEDFRDAD